MARHISIFLVVVLIFLSLLFPAFSLECPDRNRPLGVAQKMESAFKEVEDYTCEAEVLYYQDGAEDQRYHFKFYFKRGKRIRVDFSHPYPGLSVFYKEDDREAIVRPLSFLPAIRFRFSIDSSILKTKAGQRIDQTDMGYFIQFVLRNLREVEQKKSEVEEDNEQVRFLLWAMDYIEGKSLEKYRVSISKRNWLPVRIERYSVEGKPLEITAIKNYHINGGLKDEMFIP